MKTIVAHGRSVVVTRRGNRLTLNPSAARRLNPFIRTVRLRVDRDVRFIAVHEPRGVQPTGWIEFGIFIDIADPKFAEHALCRVEYRRARRREFAALVLAGGWRQIIIA